MAVRGEVGTLQYALKLVLRNLRPSPLTVHRISTFYDIPERNVAAMAGAFRVSKQFGEYAVRYAAKSDSIAKLTREERAALDEFVGLLKSTEG